MHIEWPDWYEHVDIINEGVEVLKASCGDGVWHVEQCPPALHVQCSTLQKTTRHYCTARIIAKSNSIGVPTLTYFGLSS